jgi:hypothetical protein
MPSPPFNMCMLFSLSHTHKIKNWKMKKIKKKALFNGLTIELVRDEH